MDRIYSFLFIYQCGYKETEITDVTGVIVLSNKTALEESRKNCVRRKLQELTVQNSKRNFYKLLAISTYRNALSFLFFVTKI